MKILITGNLGYVGAPLMRHLRAKYPDAHISGYDTAYFKPNITGEAPESLLDHQYTGDVRSFDETLLRDTDHVIHLAAISNDPIGHKFEQVTLDVNYKATEDIAVKAARNGVKSFVFASSCSVYGAAGDEAKTESSSLDPLTAYARSKVNAEEALGKIAPGEMKITCLRFATACGDSDRLRLDLVLNDFVASAITSNKITILSDGSPWRPLIHVKDMARALGWAMLREGEQFLICNAGSNHWNFTVKELAENVRQELGDIAISVNASAPPDKRSYKVSFDKFSMLAPGSLPLMSITETIRDLATGLKRSGFHDSNFRNSEMMRLNVLNRLIAENKLDNNLYWNPES